jgi:hypothetical protein
MDPPQRALCLAGGPGTVTGVRSALEMPTGLCHDGLIKADVHARISGHE